MKIIKDELKKIDLKNKNDYYKINALLLKFFFQDGELNENDCYNNIFDGSNDKGIDFGYYDQEMETLYLCQTKHQEKYSPNSIIADFDKMIRTIEEYKKDGEVENSNQWLSIFLTTVKNQYIGDIKDLSVSLCFFLPKIEVENKDYLIKKMNFKNIKNININIYDCNDIQDQINYIYNVSKPVPEEGKLKIILNNDRKGKFLCYQNSKMKSYVFTTNAISIKDLYLKTASKGLLSLNLRYFTKNKKIDSKITKTITDSKNSEDFWFLNNGITMICEGINPDGLEMKFKNFAILNGGQTTYLIAKHFKPEEHKDFHIQCRLIEVLPNLDKNKQKFLWDKISECTNTQKPINDRDLKSNAPEMIQLKKHLSEKNWDLGIRKGEARDKNKKFINNVRFGNLIRSFIYQEPAAAKNKTKELFSSDDVYDKIYKKIKIIENINFISSILMFNECFQKKYSELGKDLFKNDEGIITASARERLELYNNSNTFILAVIGLFFKLINEEINISKIEKYIDNSEFSDMVSSFSKNGNFFITYLNDDIDSKMKELIELIADLIYDAYKKYNSSNKYSTPANITKKEDFYRKYIIWEVLTYLQGYKGKRFTEETIKPLLIISKEKNN